MEIDSSVISAFANSYTSFFSFEKYQFECNVITFDYCVIKVPFTAFIKHKPVNYQPGDIIPMIQVEVKIHIVEEDGDIKAQCGLNNMAGDSEDYI